jgi:hypothetical protein
MRKQVTGGVNLGNNGGFVQAGFDISHSGLLDASDFSGIEIAVFGNSEIYSRVCVRMILA